MRVIESKDSKELKNDEIRQILFFDPAPSFLNKTIVSNARSKLWFKWSGADTFQNNFPDGYAQSMLDGEIRQPLTDGMRVILDITESEIEKDLSRTFSDSELRARYQVKFRIWRLANPYSLSF